MIELEPIRESPMVLSWTALAVIFILLAVYMRGFSERSYPRIAWLSYVVLGGALLLGVSFRHEFHATHVPYLRWGLLLAAAFFGGALYIVSSAYADTLAIQTDGGQCDG